MPKRLSGRVVAKACFIEPILLLKVDSLPDDSQAWSYELKLDGYRAIAFNAGGKISLRSRNDKDFSKYAAVLRGLAKLPVETVIDGEVEAMDSEGRPSFSLLQNYSSAGVQLLYFVFDVMILRGKDVMHDPYRYVGNCYRVCCRSWPNQYAMCHRSTST
jgi:ATP-dependent DNA ligase